MNKLNLGFLVWAVARPCHIITNDNLLKLEFLVILVDCEGI